jgi:multimeric flavodoxin WrbA
VDTELIHLYDYTFTGCISCFACKKIGGHSYGRCAKQDELTPILAQAHDADALLLGSPIYCGTESAGMRAFMERLIFSYYTYSTEAPSLFPRRIKTGLIYTMNVTEEECVMLGYDTQIARSQGYLQRIFGACDILLCTDTYQFEEYSMYESSSLDSARKARRRREVFPKDCEKAYEMGRRCALDVVPEHGR